MSQVLRVRVDTLGSTAKADNDYTNPDVYGRIGTQYWIDIPAEALSKTIIITPVMDDTVEDDELVIFTLVKTNNNTYIVGPGTSANLFIKDHVEGIFKDSFEDL